MTICLVLIGLIVFGILLSRIDDLFGTLICTVAGILLSLHLGGWAFASYEYELFVERRNAFESTLKQSREQQREYETAAIIKVVSEWNVELAEYQYNNNTWLFDAYIDDRIELLEPIY